MIYLRLGSSACKVIVLLIRQMKGGANDLHVIMCYNTEGIDSMQQYITEQYSEKNQAK